MQPKSICLYAGLWRNRALQGRRLINICRLVMSMDGDTRNGESSNNYVWCPTEIIMGRNVNACIVLNRRIHIPPRVAQSLWENAQLRCTVDGGTNRWRHFLNTHCKGQRMKPPDLITGDFDSITQETVEYFNDPATQRIHTPDQNATDFTKSLMVVQPLLRNAINDIIVFHDTSGRLDQIMANINTLYKMQSDELRVYLLSGCSMTWVLQPGKHSIKIPRDLVEKQRWCSLMPIGEPASNVTTQGLKWNLKNSVMQFGGMVSTSNTYASEQVKIETETSLVWSMGLFNFDDD